MRANGTQDGLGDRVEELADAAHEGIVGIDDVEVYHQLRMTEKKIK